MAAELKEFDARDVIKAPEDQKDYMQVFLGEKDVPAAMFPPALGKIVNAYGASKFARESGISRGTIYKQFRADGNPRLDTIEKAMSALGLELRLSGVPKA